MSENKNADPAYILSCRSAYALYLQEGIDEVQQQFQKCVAFVKQHAGKSLEEVTAELSAQLDLSTRI